ncbi:MAG: bifunctional phosphoribosylaminoimidazolecarboxamide formyltransferase/IMP cyclohydrolase [Chloroflexota bacterium]
MRALISVYDKTGIADFARKLSALGIELISSGGTAAELRSAGLAVTDVAELTGFPDMLDGRVKTLHPAIHAGILAKRDNEEHMETLREHGIGTIDLVVCGLYPFQANPSVELIDVGGPTLIRAAAKNYASVAVLVNPVDYEPVLAELRLYREVSEPTRKRLAEAAFALTASYDAAIAAWLNRSNQRLFPARLALGLEKRFDLRYGENPHQEAAFYGLVQDSRDYPSLAGARQVQGKELSFNNLLDLDAAIEIVTAFDEPAVVIVKHGNPCGLAVREELAEAFRLALAGDPLSAYGGVVGANRTLDATTAEAMGPLFVEAVVAPEFESLALGRLSRKVNARLVELPGDWTARPGPYTDLDFKRIRGGLLVQTRDFDAGNLGFRVVTTRQPTAEQVEDLKFAWKAVRHVRSNGIVLARERALVGVGAGQASRVLSVQIAAEKAGERSRGAVLASDGFFPATDGIEAAAKAGVTAIIQPGGSKKDADCTAAANTAGIAMVFTAERHFKH